MSKNPLYRVYLYIYVYLSAQSPDHSSLEDTTQTRQPQGGTHPSPTDPAAGRQLAIGVDIPRHADAEAVLVPSSCHSICQHYSDLHIAGGQVLPLRPSTLEVQGNLIQDPEHGPFLLSGDVPFPSLLPPLVHGNRNSRFGHHSEEPACVSTSTSQQ
ncbi:uncharacterized protein CXorf21-like [Carassius auratus]|uniref:Uncharacterized protein CXorf21-like n=1 Tax=Carassius auratus TaxID=7957 RepID=A0A6P6MZZ9_CARAU|nr:uncharacterized protein CXorf21-like [Carassius auratus]